MKSISTISAETAIGQNHIPNMVYIDQGPEDGLELDNLLLDRRSSIKSNNSRRSSTFSRKESVPVVQVIPPSVSGGMHSIYMSILRFHIKLITIKK